MGLRIGVRPARTSEDASVRARAATSPLGQDMFHTTQGVFTWLQDGRIFDEEWGCVEPELSGPLAEIFSAFYPKAEAERRRSARAVA